MHTIGRQKLYTMCQFVDLSRVTYARTVSSVRRLIHTMVLSWETKLSQLVDLSWVTGYACTVSSVRRLMHTVGRQKLYTMSQLADLRRVTYARTVSSVRRLMHTMVLSWETMLFTVSQVSDRSWVIMHTQFPWSGD